MKKLILVFILALASSFQSYADEDELLINAVEYEKIIVNWNQQENQLARVLAYECLDCEVRSLIVNKETQLEDENGEHLSVYELSNKVDWQGTVQTTNRNPELIIKIMLH